MVMMNGDGDAPLRQNLVAADLSVVKKDDNGAMITGVGGITNSIFTNETAYMQGDFLSLSLP